jgi:hypothetical protein
MEISPVLAGTYAAPDVAAAKVNFTVGNPPPATTNISDSSETGDRRHTKFDRTASNVGSADMSFGDFLDMLNPLEHIPIISSVYREITGDKIDPVARVAGDILYGGALGMVSAMASGIGAVADSVMETKTGKDVTGTMVATLFDTDETSGTNQSIQLASAEVPAAAIAPQLPTQTSTPATTTPQTSTETKLAEGIPLNRNKLPFGGAMAPVKSTQEQEMAMSLAKATGGMHVGNTIYANRLANMHLPPTVTPPTVKIAAAEPALTTPPPLMSTPVDVKMTPAEPSAKIATIVITPSPAVTAPAPSSTPAETATVEESKTTVTAPISTAQTTLPPALIDDAYILKALGVYRNVAGNAASSAVAADTKIVN